MRHSGSDPDCLIECFTGESCLEVWYILHMNRRRYIFPTLVLLLGLILSMGCGTILDSVLFIEVEVSTHSLAFTGETGGEIAAQTVTASCTEDDPDSVIERNCSAGVTSNQEWLLVTPNEIYGMEELTISINTEGLEAGSHTGTVHVESYLPAIDDEEDIGVTLTLTDP